jgi:4-hydroxy-tetrahydrodipicolinate reductase
MKMMKVGLIGFGRTGKAVASVILDNPDICLEWVMLKSHILEHRSVPEFLGIESREPGFIHSIDEFTAEGLLDHLPVDVIIDFSSATGIHYYGKAAADQGVTIVSAISHYEQSEIEVLHTLAEKTRVLWSPNITVGINFMITAAKVLRRITPDTDIEIIEEHFKGKTGASGTALRIASELNVEACEVRSIRAGGIIGTHEILFGFPFQTVRLRHESISREAFGKGAMFAAEHLIDKPNGLYRMEDLMLPYFGSSE